MLGAVLIWQGRAAEAEPWVQRAERLAELLAAAHMLLPPTQALRLVTLARLGQTERAEHDIAELGDQDRRSTPWNARSIWPNPTARTSSS
jgi:hypothetical protein